MAEEVPHIRLEDVSFRYDRSVKMIEGFNASFSRTSTTLLAGANGAGKTTLVKLIVGLLAPHRGNVVVGGKRAHETPLHQIAAQIAVSPQKAEYQMFLTTVRKELAFGPEHLLRPTADALTADAMELFELSNVADVHPYDIHASRRKLLSLAAAVAMDSPFLIFDEPTSGLSKPEKAVFSAALRTLRDRGKGYLLISHDLSFALPCCERTLMLKDGACLADEKTAGLLERADASAIARKACVRLPVAARLSALFGHRPVTRSAEEFVSLLKDRSHDH